MLTGFFSLSTMWIENESVVFVETGFVMFYPLILTENLSKGLMTE